MKITTRKIKLADLQVGMLVIWSGGQAPVISVAHHGRGKVTYQIQGFAPHTSTRSRQIWISETEATNF